MATAGAGQLSTAGAGQLAPAALLICLIVLTLYWPCTSCSAHLPDCADLILTLHQLLCSSAWLFWPYTDPAPAALLIYLLILTLYRSCTSCSVLTIYWSCTSCSTHLPDCADLILTLHQLLYSPAWLCWPYIDPAPAALLICLIVLTFYWPCTSCSTHLPDCSDHILILHQLLCWPTCMLILILYNIA
jgi:hypothetical protein